MQKVIILGDTHGETYCLPPVFETAEADDVIAVVQVGDFGFWPYSEYGIRFLDRIAKQSPVPWFFVDGNHEYHPGLNQNANQPYAVHDQVYHIPRGVRFRLGQTTFLGAGGAVSVDAHWRTEGLDWFPEESLSWGQIERIIENGTGVGTSIDVVLAHDCPIEVPLRLYSGVFPEDLTAKGDKHRATMSYIRNQVKPRYWFAGHYHQRVSARVEETQVEVLHCDSAPFRQQAAIFDVDERVIV